MWIGIPAVGETAARMATCDDERRGGAGGTNVRESFFIARSALSFPVEG
jgi:hypothetical protein